MTNAEKLLTPIFTRRMFCGCGSDDAKWGIVLWILERCGDYSKTSTLYDEAEAHPELGDWIEFALHTIDHMGESGSRLIEHGSGILGSWLEDAGRELLKFLREHGTREDDFPEWAREALGCMPLDPSSPQGGDR